MNAGTNKLFCLLDHKPVIVHTLEVLQKCERIAHIILAVSSGEQEIFQDLIDRHALSKVIRLVVGGPRRQDSVYNMLEAAGSPDMVAIHDGARPLLTRQDLARVLEIPDGFDGVILGAPLKDTLKHVGGSQVILDTPRREDYWLAQTPQVFRHGTILKAYASAKDSGMCATDDSSMVELMGGKVKIVQALSENLKITTMEDLVAAETILRERKSTHANG